MFQFEISNYEDAFLEEEVADLLSQYLEKESRDRLPGLWKLTDSLNTYAQKGPGREKRKFRYNLYGGIICFMGTWLFIFGIMPPVNKSMIMVGVLDFLAAAFLFMLANKKRPSDIPDICRRPAAEMVASLRQKDWAKFKYRITVGNDRILITSEDGTEEIPNDRMGALYSTKHLYMVTYDNDKCLLIQKKDLASAEGFEKVGRENDRS